MNKYSFPLLLGIAFLLAACADSETEPTVQAILDEPTVQPTIQEEVEAEEATESPTPTRSPDSPTNTPAVEGEEPGSDQTPPLPSPDSPQPGEPMEISIEADDGLAIVGTFYPGATPPPWPGAMLLHMNGRTREDWDPVARQLAKNGYAALAVDMRGHGQTGGERDWDQAADDLLRVWDYLAGRDQVDADNTAVVGASIGANMSLVTAAAQRSIKTAVLLSAGLDYFGVTTDDAIVDYGQRPIFLVASEDDPQAAESARQLRELALGETELLIYEDAGHGTAMFSSRPELAGQIIQWLDDHLKGQRAEQAAGGSLPTPTLFDFDWDDRSPFRAGLIDAEAAVLEEAPGASVYHLDLQIAPDLQSVSGRQEVRYTNQENESLEALHFHLFPNILGGRIAISELTVNDVPTDPSYVKARSVLQVPLEKLLAPGEQVVVQMAYQVEIPTEGGSNYGVFATIDGVLALAHFYPQISVYDDEGWNIEFPSENADVTYADVAYYLVRVGAPAEVTVVASGIEVDRQVTDNGQELFIAAGPVRDFYIAASAAYTVVSQSVGQTKVNSYGFPQFLERTEQTLDIAVAALEGFQERLGAYPYTEFDLAPTPNLALGVEYPGAVVIRSALYDPEALLGETPSGYYLEATVAHEVGHQWFYGVVGNDQLDEPWVDESLVQYLTYLYFVDTYGTAGGTAFQASFLSRWDRVDREEIPIGLPAGEYDGLEYGAIVYGRGPLFFDALAAEMGEEAFSSFLMDHYQRNKYGIATGEEIQTLAEEHCSCDLSDLFAEWVYES